MPDLVPVDGQKSTTGLDVRLAAALSYFFGPLSGLAFLMIEKDSPFVRFHAMQAVLTFGALFVAGVVAGFVPIIGWLIGLVLTPISVILWILLMFKAFSGEYFKLPALGDMAQERT